MSASQMTQALRTIQSMVSEIPTSKPSDGELRERCNEQAATLKVIRILCGAALEQQKELGFGQADIDIIFGEKELTKHGQYV